MSFWSFWALLLVACHSGTWDVRRIWFAGDNDRRGYGYTCTKKMDGSAQQVCYFLQRGLNQIPWDGRVDAPDSPTNITQKKPVPWILTVLGSPFIPPPSPLVAYLIHIAYLILYCYYFTLFFRSINRHCCIVSCRSRFITIQRTVRTVA